jgi:hypothetical protein
MAPSGGVGAGASGKSAVPGAVKGGGQRQQQRVSDHHLLNVECTTQHHAIQTQRSAEVSR